jgi:hypothetical protein
MANRDNTFGASAMIISGTVIIARGTFAASDAHIRPGIATGANVAPTSMPTG